MQSIGNVCPELLEAADISRLAGVSRQTVLLDTIRGLLQPAARTRRGTRLYAPAAVDAYVRVRDERRKQAARESAA
jgi:DNA-binding transcriptional MerR regulator